MDFGRTIVMGQRGDVFVEVGRTRRADAQRVHLRTRQAVEVVELDRRERRAESGAACGGGS